MKRRFAVTMLSALLPMAAVSFSSMSGTRLSESKAAVARVPQESHRKKALDSLGIELPVEYKCMDQGCECLGENQLDQEETTDAKMLVLPGDRMLVGICDTLFELDANYREVWHHTVPAALIDFAFIEVTGLVYVTSLDNCMFVLDASTGKVLVRNSRNGSMAYGQVMPYLDDICLVADDNSMYRSKLNDPNINDSLTAWRGTETLWSIDLPPGAIPVASGSRILALTTSKKGAFLREIPVPNATILKKTS
jgi:hypothetical protein